MNKMKISILIMVGIMTTGIIGPTIVSANELATEQEATQVITVDASKYRSLPEIESEINTKIRAKGYKNKEEYNMAIGVDFPIEESVYYNNLEYYTVAANTNGDEKAPAILSLFGAKVLFSDWAKGMVFKFVKNIVAPGVAYDAIKKVGTNGIEMVTVEGQYVGYGYYLQGHPVHVLQTGLRDRGYNIAVDGYFGPATESALKSFQRSQGLTADGICGRSTWRKLYK